jgi:hypothetical protein
MKYAYADIRSRYTERTAASACGSIQIPQKSIAFYASAKRSKRKKPLTPASESNAEKILRAGDYADLIKGKLKVRFVGD